MNIINLIKKENIMLFLVSGFFKFLIFLNKRKIIFIINCKILYGILLGFFMNKILEKGVVYKSSLLNIIELKDIFFKITSATNPGGSNMTLKAALETLKKSENINELGVPLEELGKNIMETSVNMAAANLMPVYGFGICFGIGLGYNIFKIVKVMDPVFNEKMNGLLILFNKVLYDENLSNNYLITKIIMGSSKALLSLGLYEWGIIIGIIGVTGVLSYIMVTLVLNTDNKKLFDDENLIKQELNSPFYFSPFFFFNK